MSLVTSQSAAPTHKLRWYQYSLRTLMVLMLLTSIGSSCYLVVKRFLETTSITDALERPATIECSEKPLADVADYLQGAHHISIKIDEDALLAAGRNAKEPVTMNVRGISLQSALRLMLRQMGLTYVTRGNVLWITTPQQAAAKGESTVAVRIGYLTQLRIKEALKSPTAPIEFVETPLQDVVDYLKDAHHIEIQLDSKALKEARIDNEIDSEITCNLHHVSLQSSLRLLLRPMGLDYVVRDEVLLITTANEAAIMNAPRRNFKTPAMVANEKRVRDALASQSQVDFGALLLAPALDGIRNRYGIEIYIDPSAMKAVESDSPGKTASGPKGISLQSALDAKLDRLGLRAEVRDEVLLIVPKNGGEQ